MTYSLDTLNSSADLPAPAEGFGRFVREAVLIAGAMLLLFWALALLSHSVLDPAWSTSGSGTTSGVRNWGGRVGAWWADVNYFVLGFSAWWVWLALGRTWLMWLARWLRGGQRPAGATRGLHGALWLLGLLVLLSASCTLEWSRFYRFEAGLPGSAGGALGFVLGPVAVRWLGFNGSGLVAIALGLLAAAWVLRFSWSHLAESLGAWIDERVMSLRARREHAHDAELGRQAALARDAAVTREMHAVEPHLDLAAVPSLNADTPSPAAGAPFGNDPTTGAVRANVPAGARRAATNDAASTPMPTMPARAAAQASGDQPAFDADRPDVAPAFTAATGAAAFTAAAAPVTATAAASVAVAAAPEPAGEAPMAVARHGVHPQAAPVIVEPVLMDVPRSDRVIKEKQKPLFSEMPDSPLPQVDLLDAAPARQETVGTETLEMTSRLIEKRLRDFGVQVTVVAAYPGPVVTRYEIEPATGVKGAQIVGLAKDLARSLSLVSIRVVETIPGKNYMALELPNARRQTIRLSEILGSVVYHEAKSLLTMGLGKDIVGNPVLADLAKMPHCLVAGTTGSGKSVGINAMILSLLYKAEARDVRLLMIDPKMLEMSVYEGIPHLLAPVVTDMKQAANGLNWCVGEMERRYKLMSKLGVRNLGGYNGKIDDARARGEFIYNPFSLTPEEPEPLDRLPHIVVVIDELADLMMVVGKKIEELIARLAQKARAAGIHLILATQRPSVDVITGLIKANIPTRIAFQVSSKIDSRTILDQMGAEALLGMGDMLYMAGGTGLPIRVHGAFVSDDEVHRVVSYLKTQGEPDYIEGVLEGGLADGEDGAAGGTGDGGGEKDPLYDQAVEVVLKNRKASISLVQRHLKIGYNRAARLVEDMEKAGLVSSMSTSGQRDILVPTRAE